MSSKGFSHIGLSTLDLDKTRDFYEGVLGLKPVVADTLKVTEGGRLRHLWEEGKLRAGKKGAELTVGRLSEMHRQRAIDSRRFPAEGW